MSRSRYYPGRRKTHYAEWKKRRDDVLHAIAPRRHFYRDRKYPQRFSRMLKVEVTDRNGANPPTVFQHGLVVRSSSSGWHHLSANVIYTFG